MTNRTRAFCCPRWQTRMLAESADSQLTATDLLDSYGREEQSETNKLF